MKTKFTPENLALNVFLYGRHLFQERNGDPKPERKWPSEKYWKLKVLYPYPFRDSSTESESEDDQEQVGHRNKVKRKAYFYF